MNDLRSGSRRDALATRYGFDAWPAEGDERVRISGFEFADGDIPGYRRHRVVSAPPPPGVLAAHESVWVGAETEPGANDAVLLVDVYECASHEQAQEALLSVLGQVQSAAVQGLEGIGEVAFSPGEGAVLFVRGNLAVRVLSGGPGAEPVRDMAQGFDETVRRRSQGERPGSVR